ncbi:cytochrome c peroxidase [uncultured Thiothrix sp.]|uniref:cytochrome-c peroxidase n=1 Tax=uncultured Thiothrix sp. TaxID=223185 RepID=UPI0026183607|nr:cytochrome c peroxidase [uncultured Thiothrix sp.]
MIRHRGILLLVIGLAFNAHAELNLPTTIHENTKQTGYATTQLATAPHLEGVKPSQTTTETPVHFTVHELSQIKHLTLSHRLAPQDLSNKYATHPLAIALGKVLFFDTRLSSDHQVACATCHNPKQGWSTPDPRISLRGVTLKRHTPSLWNTGYQRWQFWDGRADSLWLQAIESMENEAEMKGDRVHAVRLILADANLQTSYRSIFGELPPTLSLTALPLRAKPRPKQEGITVTDETIHQAWEQLPATVRQDINQVTTHLMKSIAAFEMTITSPPTRVDQFIDQLIVDQGQITTNNSWLNSEEQQGLKLFVSKAQCIQCHSGSNFSDGEFHRIFFDKSPDWGRAIGISSLLSNPFNGNSVYADQHPLPNRLELLNAVSTIPFRAAFKTPSLRNLSTSAPYMHDGRFASLDEVIKHYNEIQPRGHHAEAVLKPLGLTPQEQEYLVQFLQVLSSQL